MYILLRLTPFLSSLFAFAILLVLFLQPDLLFSFIGSDKLSLNKLIALIIISNFCLMIAMIFLGAGQFLHNRLRYFGYILITWSSGLLLFLFSDQKSVLLTIMLVIPFLLWIWLESLYLLWQRPSSYQTKTLERLANYLYLIKIFLFISVLIGLRVFLQTPFWFSLLLVVIVLFLIQYDYYQLSKFSLRESLVFSCIGTVLALQIYLVLNLLPTHFFLYGLIISLFFYVWLNLSKQALKRSYNKRENGLIIVVTACGMITVFVSSLLIR